MTYIVAGIFARGGSKGLPGKNIKMLGDKPLIAHTITVARACPHIDYIFVSTDSGEIADVARQYGADVPFMRPPELATDTAPERKAWQHAINFLNDSPEHPELDAFVCLPATAPLRAIEDVTACIELFLNTQPDIVLTVSPADRSPYFNMVKLDDKNEVSLLMEGRFTRRQDAPTVYDITPVAYVGNPNHILETNHIFDGKVRAYVVEPERSYDIDTPLDFKIVETVYNSKKTE